MNLEIRFLLLSLLLILLGQLRPVSDFRRGVRELTAPLRYGAFQASVRLGRFLSFGKSLGNIYEEDRQLRGRIIELEAYSAELKEVKAENSMLRQQLGMKVEQVSDLLDARITGWRDFISKGLILIKTSSGAAAPKGSVVAFGGNLVGRVTAVSEGESTVQLVTDPGSVVFALDQDSPERARGVVRGLAPGRLVMESILPEERVLVGDTVVTSGMDSGVPSGLILGKVDRVEIDKGILQRAFLTTVLDFYQLERVFVLTPR